MTDRILRWGLLSTARINRSLIPPLRASPRNELAAVASRDLQKAQAYAAEWNIPRVFASYEAMLADPDIDVIYNPLPNSLHADWTIRAVEAGKHVLCEKPLALSSEDVDRIARSAQAAGRVVSEAFMYRHHPQTLRTRELLGEGVIGELLLIRAAFSFRLTDPANVRYDPSLGGGSLWDVGCYPVSWIRTMAGREPAEVHGWARWTARGVDDLFVGQMRLDNGVLAQFDCGFSAPFRTLAEMVGAEGTLRVARPFKPPGLGEIEIQRGDTVERVATGEQALYVGEVQDLADAVLDGCPPRITLDDSRANTAAIVALYDSARRGEPVRLPPADAAEA
jgi:predicted dehydrogenase